MRKLELNFILLSKIRPNFGKLHKIVLKMENCLKNLVQFVTLFEIRLNFGQLS